MTLKIKKKKKNCWKQERGERVYVRDSLTFDSFGSSGQRDGVNLDSGELGPVIVSKRVVVVVGISYRRYKRGGGHNLVDSLIYKQSLMKFLVFINKALHILLLFRMYGQRYMVCCRALIKAQSYIYCWLCIFAKDLYIYNVHWIPKLKEFTICMV